MSTVTIDDVTMVDDRHGYNKYNITITEDDGKTRTIVAVDTITQDEDGHVIAESPDGIPDSFIYTEVDGKKVTGGSQNYVSDADVIAVKEEVKRFRNHLSFELRQVVQNFYNSQESAAFQWHHLFPKFPKDKTEIDAKTHWGRWHYKFDRHKVYDKNRLKWTGSDYSTTTLTDPENGEQWYAVTRGDGLGEETVRLSFEMADRQTKVMITYATPPCSEYADEYVTDGLARGSDAYLEVFDHSFNEVRRAMQMVVDPDAPEPILECELLDNCLKSL